MQRRCISVNASSTFLASSGENSTSNSAVDSVIFKIALLMEQQETGLILADEAFNALSGENLNRILEVISNLPIQLLCISHNPNIDKNLVKEIYIEKKNDVSTIRR